jgi:hypothetical protein
MPCEASTYLLSKRLSALLIADIFTLVRVFLSIFTLQIPLLHPHLMQHKPRFCIRPPRLMIGGSTQQKVEQRPMPPQHPPQAMRQDRMKQPQPIKQLAWIFA